MAILKLKIIHGRGKSRLEVGKSGESSCLLQIHGPVEDGKNILLEKRGLENLIRELERINEKLIYDKQVKENV